jgi:hypothetical protein
MCTYHIIGSHNIFIQRVRFEDVCKLECIQWCLLGVWTIGIQQERNISQSLFIIHMSSLHHYKEKLPWLLPALVYFSAGIPGGTTNIQTVLDLCVLLRWGDLSCEWCCE